MKKKQKAKKKDHVKKDHVKKEPDLVERFDLPEEMRGIKRLKIVDENGQAKEYNQ